MKFFCTEKIGPKRSMTPDGFMILHDVPLARTGLMVYGPGEVPIEAGPDGIVRVYRLPEEVFAKEAIASVNGKPVVDEHPDEDVTPENYQELSKGHGLNARQGEGLLSDLLLADLVITNKDMMDAIDDGKREISLGYDADYIEDEERPGYGWQRNIRVNHIALVDSGRCGPRCAIGDTATANIGRSNMANKNGAGLDVFQRIRRALRTKDSAELEKALKEGEEHAERDAAIDPGSSPIGASEGNEVHVHLHTGAHDSEESREEKEERREEKNEDRRARDDAHRFTDDEIEERFASLEAGHQEILATLAGIQEQLGGAEEEVLEEDDTYDENKEEREEEEGEREESHDEGSLEGNLKMEAPPGTGDRARKARDSKYLEDSFAATMAGAEILAPGIRLPTFDRSARPKITFHRLCNVRRRALDAAFQGDEEIRELITEVTGEDEFKPRRMTCDAVRTLFRTAVAAKKKANNANATRSTDRGRSTNDRGGAEKPKILSISDINARNRAKYGINNGTK